MTRGKSNSGQNARWNPGEAVVPWTQVGKQMGMSRMNAYYIYRKALAGIMHELLDDPATQGWLPDSSEMTWAECYIKAQSPHFQNLIRDVVQDNQIEAEDDSLKNISNPIGLMTKTFSTTEETS